MVGVWWGLGDQGTKGLETQCNRGHRRREEERKGMEKMGAETVN